MKKLSITTALLLGLVFSAFSQVDTMYVVEEGVVVFKRAISSNDTVTFINPIKTVGTAASIGDFRDGGVVFWIDPSDDTKGLVVDVNGFDYTAPWGCGGTRISTGRAIGSGAQNTINIVRGCTSRNTAASFCSESTSGGYSDWFLPSMDELNEIFKYESVIDSAAILGGLYWTSTERDEDNAWVINSVYDPYRNSLNWNGKNGYNMNARAVRAFSAFSQPDTMYVLEAGAVVYKRATSLIDSVTFKNPIKTVGATASIGDFRDGGVVFWVDPSDNTKGLVVDVNDLSKAEWGCENRFIKWGGLAIGTGEQNTLDILAACSTVVTAAELCSQSTSGGYSDWFLPSVDELNEMYKNKSVIDSVAMLNGGNGFYSNPYYWASSMWNGDTRSESAWCQDFAGGKQFSYKRGEYLNVRAVRSF